MSTETLEKPVVKEAEPLFSKRRKKFVTDPLNDDNPVTVQVLGICSALAVTVKMQPTLVMAIAVTLVIVFSNLLISLMRTLIPNRVRIIVQLAVVATLVTLVSEVLKAY
ncbi:MAG: Rnf-Nqr domain containing protein, partial [Imperialibacter sp.]